MTNVNKKVHVATKKRLRVNLTKNFYEKLAWTDNHAVCGIDEVGRGCLAGPLVTAAVILPPGKTHRLLKDSKLMTEEERLKASLWIAKNGWVSYGIIHHRTIDKHNIWQATLIGMKKALVNLLATCPLKPASILVDAMPLTLLDTNFHTIPVHHFPFGEKLSTSIAAASIMAKVKRDALMGKLDPLFPGYLLAQHKGYATALHYKAVGDLNYSMIHRLSFLKKTLNPPSIDQENHEEQQRIC
ncbi:MAG: ribonuclease HII [Candidatus Dependentiae bacterium]|nr:ribonuclease HII [Candidatus Dependentiae bacterium]